MNQDQLDSALFKFSQMGQTKVVEKLLSLGANPNKYDMGIFYAVRHNHIETVKILLNSYLSGIPYFNYLLKCAEEEGHKEMYNILYENIKKNPSPRHSSLARLPFDYTAESNLEAT